MQCEGRASWVYSQHIGGEPLIANLSLYNTLITKDSWFPQRILHKVYSYYGSYLQNILNLTRSFQWMLLPNVHYFKPAVKATDIKFKWVSNIVQQLSWSKLTRSQIFHPRESCKFNRIVKWELNPVLWNGFVGKEFLRVMEFYWLLKWKSKCSILWDSFQ